MTRRKSLCLLSIAFAVSFFSADLPAAESDSRLTNKLEAALNQQVNAELSSSYLYLSVVAYFEDVDLPGFAHWMRIQTQEETMHGHMIFDYIMERNGRAILSKIDAPQTEWASPLAAFQAAYDHEKHISSLISRLVRMSRDDNDESTENFLRWFVAEQVEEEAAAYRIVRQLRLIGDDRSGLYLLDRELAQRPAAAAPAAAGAPALP